MNPTFKYGSDNDCSFEIVGLKKTKYASNNALAVIAVINVIEKGQVVEQENMPVSINFDHAVNSHASDELPANEFIAKSYSEGERLFNALLEADWIRTTGKKFASGFVVCPACYITSKAIISG